MPSVPAVPTAAGPVGSPHRPNSKPASTRDPTPPVRKEVSRPPSASNPRLASTRAPTPSSARYTPAHSRAPSAVGKMPLSDRQQQGSQPATPGARSATPSQQRAANASSVRSESSPRAAALPRSQSVPLQISSNERPSPGRSGSVPLAPVQTPRTVSAAGSRPSSAGTKPQPIPVSSGTLPRSTLASDKLTFYKRLLDRRFDRACLDLLDDKQMLKEKARELKKKTISNDSISLVSFKLEVCAIAAPYLEAAALRSIAKATRVIFASTKQQYPVVSMDCPTQLVPHSLTSSCSSRSSMQTTGCKVWSISQSARPQERVCRMLYTIANNAMTHFSGI